MLKTELIADLSLLSGRCFFVFNSTLQGSEVVIERHFLVDELEITFRSVNVNVIYIICINIRTENKSVEMFSSVTCFP